jgi:hypothetical protein
MTRAEAGQTNPVPAEDLSVAEAVARATRQAALEHARLGYAVPISRDGKVVWLQPAEVFALLGEQLPVRSSD